MVIEYIGMIIEFTVENYLSFKSKTTLSMVGSKSFREHKKSHLIKVDEKLSLLKSSIIYGNNASGKSNLIKAMLFMKRFLLNSFRDALDEKKEILDPNNKFVLNSKYTDLPSSFEISFIQNDIKYRYGFTIDSNEIISEWLYHTSSKEVLLFKRDLQKIEINKSSFKEGIGKEKEVRSNVLFISMLATINKEVSSNIVNWFKKFNFVSGITDIGHKKYTIEKLKNDQNFSNWVIQFIKYLEISNLSTSEEDISLEDLINKNSINEDLVEVISNNSSNQKSIKKDQIHTYHRKYDDNNFLVDTIPFNFEKQESEGTKKLIYLLGPWYDTLKNGKTLVVDELDSRLHSHLSLRLINLFHEFNLNNSQLIFVSHDSTLLDKSIFRRDQIWFIEKTQYGDSEILSLGDFKSSHVRNTSSFSKNYLAGKYGAIPYFEDDHNLSNYIYG